MRFNRKLTVAALAGFRTLISRRFSILTGEQDPIFPILHEQTHWGESYVYDNWGNMYQDNQLSSYSLGGNWMVTANAYNHLSNLSYDSAGQVTQDQIPNSYSYDAEGRLLTAGGGSYAYDGDGNRVKKTASSITTLYWPGAVGGIINESNSGATSFGQEVQVAGRRVWSQMVSGTGYFLFQDHLGSTRVTGDASGNLKDDIDYFPFGGVAANYKTPGSGNHYLFTGDESDASESSTDYATFRNLSYSMGRFNRPDPFDGSYDLADPQTLNRYPYVGNRSLQMTDSLGLDPTCGDGTGDDDWGCISDGSWGSDDGGGGGDWGSLLEVPTYEGYGYAFSDGWSRCDMANAVCQMQYGNGDFLRGAITVQFGGFGRGHAPSNDMKYDIFHCPSCVNTWKQSNCVVNKPFTTAADDLKWATAGAVFVGASGSMHSGVRGMLQGAIEQVGADVMAVGALGGIAFHSIVNTATSLVTGCKSE